MGRPKGSKNKPKIDSSQGANVLWHPDMKHDIEGIFAWPLQKDVSFLAGDRIALVEEWEGQLKVSFKDGGVIFISGQWTISLKPRSSIIVAPAIIDAEIVEPSNVK